MFSQLDNPGFYRRRPRPASSTAESQSRSYVGRGGCASRRRAAKDPEARRRCCEQDRCGRGMPPGCAIFSLRDRGCWRSAPCVSAVCSANAEAVSVPWLFEALRLCRSERLRSAHGSRGRNWLSLAPALFQAVSMRNADFKFSETSGSFQSTTPCRWDVHTASATWCFSCLHCCKMYASSEYSFWYYGAQACNPVGGRSCLGYLVD